MTLMSKRPARDAPAADRLSMAALVLIRVAAASAVRAELQRDLGAVFGGKSSGTAFRRAAELAIEGLTADAKIIDVKGRLTATDAGLKAVEALKLPSSTVKSGWPAVFDALVAQSLGLGGEPQSVLKAFDRLEALSGLVLQQHFGLPMSRALSMNDLRADLAVIALEQAFGNKIKTGLRKTQGLPAKAGRLLAGQLFKPAREFSSDGKLIVALAAEVTGASEQSLEALKRALLRRLVETGASVTFKAPPVAQKAQSSLRPRPANDVEPADPSVAAPRVRISPGMGEFSSAVVEAARPLSEGWPGNRKAFISLVWRAIRDTRPDWALSEIAFKSMLAEAHRTGALILSSADLKDKCDLIELERSKILYKNTVWHFVRVED